MSAQTRLEITVDVFEAKNNRALIVPQLTPREMIASILDEFRSLAYLSQMPDSYALLRARDGLVLDEASPLGQQLKPGERLILAEYQPELPKETLQPSRHAYLREEASGEVYKLHWLPAIIGRVDASLSDNDRVAVDLAAHQRGLRVSRRHAQIIEENGRFFIESLSQNATTIRDSQGRETALNSGALPLEPGDIVSLDQSQIALQLIVRDDAGG